MLYSVIIKIKPGLNISIIRFNKFIIIKEEYIRLLILLGEFKRLFSIRNSIIIIILVSIGI